MKMKTIGVAAAISVACLSLVGCVSEGPSYGYERDVGTRFHGGRYYNRDHRPGYDRPDRHRDADRGDHHMNGAGRPDHGRPGGNGPGRGGQNNGDQNGGQGQNQGGGDKMIVPNQ